MTVLALALVIAGCGESAVAPPPGLGIQQPQATTNVAELRTTLLNCVQENLGEGHSLIEKFGYAGDLVLPDLFHVCEVIVKPEHQAHLRGFIATIHGATRRVRLHELERVDCDGILVLRCHGSVMICTSPPMAYTSQSPTVHSIVSVRFNSDGDIADVAAVAAPNRAHDGDAPLGIGLVGSSSGQSGPYAAMARAIVERNRFDALGIRVHHLALVAVLAAEDEQCLVFSVCCGTLGTTPRAIPSKCLITDKELRVLDLLPGYLDVVPMRGKGNVIQLAYPVEWTDRSGRMHKGQAIRIHPTPQPFELISADD